MGQKNYPLYEADYVDDLKSLVSHVAKKYAHKCAVTFEQDGRLVDVTYQQLKADVDTLSIVFHGMGIRDVKVALIGENSYHWILSYLAITSTGNVVVPLDAQLVLCDLEVILSHCGASVLIHSSSFLDTCVSLEKSVPTVEHRISMGDLTELMMTTRNAHNASKDAGNDIDPGSVAAIVYTSGTTGTPKGVALSHIGLVHDAAAPLQHVVIPDTNLLVLPLNHVFGMSAGVLAQFLGGARIYIGSSPRNLVSDMQRHQPGLICLVPLFIQLLHEGIWETARKRNKDRLLVTLTRLSNTLLALGVDVRPILFRSVLKAFGGNLKMIICGGAPLDPTLVQGLRQFGINVLNGYGITECSPTVSINRDRYYRDGSVGLVLPTCEVAIREPNENGYGEITVRGTTVMKGYHNNQEATDEVLRDGWFATGDLGYLDSDGFLFITGRKKNLIILSNGKNVHPEELEFLLLKISYIKEAVVFAENDTIVAEVFLDPEADPSCVIQLDEDVRVLNASMPRFKTITMTRVRETEFPKTATQKIKR